MTSDHFDDRSEKFPINPNHPMWKDKAMPPKKEGLRIKSQGELIDEIVKLQSELEKAKGEIARIKEFVSHDKMCILSFWEAGEPTENGGYRSKYNGKWYQTKPIDETPKCDCGLEVALSQEPKPDRETGK